MTTFDITIETLYSILRDAAKYSPIPASGRTCGQLQTFVVRTTGNPASLSTTSMGATYADRDTPYFFSRAWDRAKQNPNRIIADFPALTAFEVQNDVQRGAFQNVGKLSYLVEIAVVDVYKDDCQTKPVSCESRSINQIYHDTETLLFAAMQYLSGAVIAYTDRDSTHRIYNTAHLQYLMDNGRIGSFDVVKEIGAAITSANTSLSMRKVEMPAQNLYGTRALFSFPVQFCNDNTYLKTYPDFVPLSHEAGCIDCG